MQRRLSRLVIVVLGLSTSSFAAAADPPEPEVEKTTDTVPRPMRYFAVEVNPLATAVNRLGGQIQIALVGPLVLNGGSSRLQQPEAKQEYRSGIPEHSGMVGDPAIRGWCFELGPRLYLPQAARSGGTVAQPFFGVSYLRDDLRQTGLVECKGCRPLAEKDVTRDGFAIDIGVQVKFRPGLTLSVGLGYQWLRASDRFWDRNSTPGSHFTMPVPSDVQKTTNWPRLLFSVGYAF